MLQSLGLQRVGHDLAMEQQGIILVPFDFITNLKVD